MTNKIANTLLMTAAVLQVACGGKSKSAEMAAFMQQCNASQPCVDMYKNAARNAGIVGPAAAASLPQVAAVGAPVLPGQVTNTSLLAASVTDKQVAAQQQKIASQLQAIVSSPSSTPTATLSGSTAPSTTGGMAPASVEIGVARVPASDVASAEAPSASPASPSAPAPQLSMGTASYQPSSFDNGSAMASEPVVTTSGAGR